MSKADPARASKEFGCCGVLVVYCGDTYQKPGELRTELEKILNDNQAGAAISYVHLREQQKATLEPVLLEFGYEPMWGPLVNPNTNNKIYGYCLNLTARRAKQETKVTGLFRKLWS